MQTLDALLFRLINGLAGHNATLDAAFAFLTAIGTGGAIWVAFALLLLFGAGRLPGLRDTGFARWRSVGLALLLALALAGGTESELKRVIARPRPPLTLSGVHVIGTLPDSYSFPSGHTLSSFAAAGVLLAASRMTNRQDSKAAVLLAALIGFSRIYVGHHYPLDVLAGAAIGLAEGLLVWWPFGALSMRKASRRAASPH